MLISIVGSYFGKEPEPEILLTPEQVSYLINYEHVETITWVEFGKYMIYTAKRVESLIKQLEEKVNNDKH